MSIAVSAGLHLAVVVATAAVGARPAAPPPRLSITFVTTVGAAPLPLPGVRRTVDTDVPSRSRRAEAAPDAAVAPVAPRRVPVPSDADVRSPDPPAPAAASTLVDTPEAPAAVDRIDPIVGAFDRAIAERPRPAAALVRAAGFAARAATVSPDAGRNTVRAAGFDRDVAPRGLMTIAAPRAVVIDTPVEVTFKPAADYTDEARALRIEGEVVLEVEFGASSEVSVVRVVRGLGHGLDESASRAVSRIRFRAALSGGAPVDVRALVHIEFRLT